MVVLQLSARFSAIVGADPLSAVMLLCGILLMGITIVVAGILVMGAIADLFGGASVGHVHGRRG